MSTLGVRPIATAILVASFTTVALGQAGSTGPPKQKPVPDFRVSGTVVDENKSPLKDIEVMIAEATGKGVSLSVEALNTKANTDAKGEFSIPVAKSMFRKNQQFVIMVRRSGSSSINLSDDPIRASTGGLAVVTIDARVKEYRVEVVQKGRFTLADLNFVLLDGGPAQATATTSQAAATTCEIRVSNKEAEFPDLDLKGQLRLEVLKGEAHLTSGATLLQGSDLRVEEASIVFEKGMTVVAGTGGARLKGINHPEGTRLAVREDGVLVPIRSDGVAQSGCAANYTIDVTVELSREITQGENRVKVELRQGAPGASKVFDTKYFEGGTGTVSFSRMCAGPHFVAIGNGDSVAVGPVRQFSESQSVRTKVRVTPSSGNVGTRSRRGL